MTLRPLVAAWWQFEEFEDRGFSHLCLPPVHTFYMAVSVLHVARPFHAFLAWSLSTEAKWGFQVPWGFGGLYLVLPNGPRHCPG